MKHTKSRAQYKLDFMNNSVNKLISLKYEAIRSGRNIKVIEEFDVEIKKLYKDIETLNKSLKEFLATYVIEDIGLTFDEALTNLNRCKRDLEYLEAAKDLNYYIQVRDETSEYISKRYEECAVEVSKLYNSLHIAECTAEFDVDF